METIIRDSGNNNTPSTETDAAPHWFVLRFLYRDQPRVRARFEADQIETFCPKQLIVTQRHGKRIKVWRPILWDLLFAHATRTELDPYVAAYDNFQYRYKTGGAYREPLTVPDEQMDRFMEAVAGSANPLYFTPQELNVAKGTRVRLIGGRMDGMEGILLKVKGARAKRLVIEIPDTLIAAVEVDADLIEVLA